MSGFPTPALSQVAATPAAGFALVNGTPNILTYTFPSDGHAHPFVLCVALAVTVTEVGGALQYVATCGGQASTRQINGGGVAGPGGFNGLSANAAGVADPGTTITISQSSALTSGAASVFVSLLSQ